MAAVCAGCLQPIQPRDKFALAGTEVFHRECVAQIARSLSTRQRLEIVRLELRANQAELKTIEVQRERAHNAEVERKLREVQAERDRLDQELRAVTRELRTARHAKRIAQNEAENLRSEIALLQTLSGARTAAPAPVAQSPTPATEGAKSDLDDSEQRFSLLELDPLE